MAEFTLTRATERKTLKVNIGEKSYNIPLAGSMTTKDARKLATAEGTYEFIEKYIPKKVLEDLTQDEYNAIVKAWIDASREDTGLSAGE